MQLVKLDNRINVPIYEWQLYSETGKLLSYLGYAVKIN